MTFAEFEASLSAASPPAGSTLAVQALWWAGKNEWNRAHACVQQREGQADCDWVHAHLHRQEGDLANAGYWYRRSGRPIATTELREEWAAIAGDILRGE